MIERMKFLSITGPKDDLERVIDTYICKYDIQLENALSELKNVQGLHPFTDANPYREIYAESEKIKASFGEGAASSDRNMTVEEAAAVVKRVSDKVKSFTDAKNKLSEKEKDYRESLSKIQQYIGLNYDLSTILHFRFIRFRFGRIAREYYDKLYSYVYDGIDSIFLKCQEYPDYIWGVYFVPDVLSEKIDAIYSSLHFERFFLPDEYTGTPSEASKNLEARIVKVENAISVVDKKISDTLAESRDDFLNANRRLAAYNKNFNIRKLAACTKDKEKTFYILCGWMEETEAAKLKKELDTDSNAFCIFEKDHSNVLSKPPTKLKNIALFRPFEMFVEMYGLPDYRELDPTVLIGLTYSIFFGFMFGDVGQGLFLMIGGALLHRKKKTNSLSAIISRCGFFSTIFGFLFGSFFGFENVIKPLWLRPAEATMSLPGVGTLNTVFIVAVAIGMVVILCTMIVNVINRVRMHEPGEALFDTNGIAGMVFYSSVILTIVLALTGHAVPAGVVAFLMFGLPLIVIFLKEPLTAVITKRADLMPKEKGMFIVQGFFELFEVLLSYFSNTLSFVRVGAFAVSHAAMMQVVLMLSGAEGGSINWGGIVFGNLFVCGMEGLIVGIQVLRLEYYELFSRFYHGSGRAFVPYGSQNKN
jgi:V/A-type H+-transporting ATPase subunit I